MRAFLLAVALLVGGCTSARSSLVMQGMIGHPIQVAMARRGPPVNAFDMPDGRRAFQWVINSRYITPTTVTDSGQAYPLGSSVWWTGNSRISGGQVVTNSCTYTLYARWSDAANAWVIEGYEKPRYGCE